MPLAEAVLLIAPALACSVQPVVSARVHLCRTDVGVEFQIALIVEIVRQRG
jgi:hypothetical protein